MPELKIKVGCSVDRNLAQAYQPIIDAANKAAAAIAAAGTKGGRSVGTSTKAGVTAAEKEYAKLGNAAERAQRAGSKSADKLAKDEAAAAKRAARDKIRAIEEITKARDRENDKIVRDAERAEKRTTAAVERGAAARARANEKTAKNAERQNARDANRYGGYAIGAARKTIGAGIGFAKTVAGGMGVDLDVGSLITKGVSLEKNATDLTNSGYMPGKGGANGTRQDPRALIDEVRKVSIATGNESGDTMEGLQAFVAKTGDLETGRAVLFDMAKLAKATGANMHDMTDAAGDVANALGEVPNKAEAVRSVMGAIAAQGKEGAVEIKDLATQMAKVGAAAGMFTGDRAQSIANMGGLVQMTRAKGGAASATQAATSVMSFMQSFSKGARLDKFNKYGVKVEAADGKIRNPRDIIIDALKATKGDNRKMGEMFADAGARRVTRGYESIYKEAGGGEQGIKKVTEAFDDLARATMLQKEIEESFSRAMATSDSKAKIFNEQLGKVVTELQSALLPALQGLAPVLIRITGDVATWIGKVTGITKSKQDTEDIGVENQALNAAGALHDGLRGGRIADGQTAEAAKAKEALQKAVDKKKKEVSDEGAFMYGGADLGKRLDTMTPEELIEATKKGASWGRGGDEEAKKFQQDKQQLDRMNETLEDLDRSLQDAMTRALEGSIITVRLNEPINIATPSISTPSGGVERPPGHQDVDH